MTSTLASPSYCSLLQFREHIFMLPHHFLHSSATIKQSELLLEVNQQGGNILDSDGNTAQQAKLVICKDVATCSSGPMHSHFLFWWCIHRPSKSDISWWYSLGQKKLRIKMLKSDFNCFLGVGINVNNCGRWAVDITYCSL